MTDGSADPDSGDDKLPHLLILYDGVCVFCRWWVSLLLKWDRDGVIYFGSAQSPLGQRVFAKYFHPKGITFQESIGVVMDGQPYVRSTAIAVILKALPMPYSLLGYMLLCFPRPVRDLGYRGVARIRYHLWGKLDDDAVSACPMVPSGARDRFLS
eukprot:TRINITY_DN46410_c0_g1_i1.p1 TRINITY_DN46410_c0_g1~~TRINITY_DN46410_c0_g1_i1.p1  ORF type:complete len:155 (+),score=13.51 TRINITY_DN46410_c0_g1_i1:280-744(+)